MVERNGKRTRNEAHHNTYALQDFLGKHPNIIEENGNDILVNDTTNIILIHNTFAPINEDANIYDKLLVD